MFPKPALLIVAALLLVLRTGAALALGLGAMRTKSALNQPFYAEIDLTGVRTDEIDAVKARLASREDFARAGAERPHFLTRLEFTLALGADGRSYIQVSSREPVREPYIDFLVEVLWPQGRLVKEYTVLLDPPALGRTALPPVGAPQTSVGRRQPPPEPTPAPPLSSSESPEQPARGGAPSAPPPRAAPAPVPAQARGTRFPLFYGPVPRGAMLIRIAREMTPPGATVEQTAMALFRNNQDAFSGGDLNRLRAGADLVVPTAEELFALDPSAARRQFQDALAGRGVNITPLTESPGDVRLRIAGDSEMPSTAPSPASVMAPAERSGLRGNVLMLQETTESNRQEAIELRHRVGELEAQINAIRRLLQLRNEPSAPSQQMLGVGVESVDDALPVTPAPGPAETDPPAKGLSTQPALSPPEGIVETAAAGGRAEDRPQDGAGEQFLLVDTPGGGAERSMPRWALAAAAVVVALGGLGLLSYRRRRERIADGEYVDTEAAPTRELVSPESPPAAGAPSHVDLVSTASRDSGFDNLPGVEIEPRMPGLPTPPSPSASSPCLPGRAVERLAGDRLDLDVDGLEGFAPRAPESAPADSRPVDDGMSNDVLSSPRRMVSEGRDESDAKLDLARAFVEMDDPDVARDLLEEVVQHGNDEQRADAAALLEKLG